MMINKREKETKTKTKTKKRETNKEIVKLTLLQIIN
jgi:hypothetical protein